MLTEQQRQRAREFFTANELAPPYDHELESLAGILAPVQPTARPDELRKAAQELWTHWRYEDSFQPNYLHTLDDLFETLGAALSPSQTEPEWTQDEIVNLHKQLNEPPPEPTEHLIRAMSGAGSQTTPVGEQIAATDGPCSNCGINCECWFTSSNLWNRVNGSPTGLLCLRCFVYKAERSGINRHAWRLSLDAITPEPRERETERP